MERRRGDVASPLHVVNDMRKCRGNLKCEIVFKKSKGMKYRLNLNLVGHDYKYEIDEIIKLFIDNPDSCNYEIVSSLEKNSAITQIFSEGEKFSEASLNKELGGLSGLEHRKLSKRILKMSLFKALKKIINKDIPWGILTGIRPTKIVHEMLENKVGLDEIFKVLTQEYEIREDKAHLLIEIAQKEINIIKNTPNNSISLYVGIPFCPTRCLYCSFTSNSMEKYSHLMDIYVDALLKEIDSVSELVSKNNWNVQTIYIGGGTPTSLSAGQLDVLLGRLDGKFNFSNLNEITVEAGRPDTITRDKLEIIKRYGVDRISINPQTMNHETLKTIRRMHSPEQIVESFKLAREVGFNNINMDIIVGLPGENETHITKTMDEILKLNPESLTVHTMSIKRASSLNENIEEYRLTEAKTIQNMLDIAKNYSEKMDMHPYYMYRQKNILGNFENVGYCKPNCEGIYNIQIMEEKQTILALGAGATSKIVFDGNRIERIFNVKNVEEYIKRIDEMIERKVRLLINAV